MANDASRVSRHPFPVSAFLLVFLAFSAAHCGRMPTQPSSQDSPLAAPGPSLAGEWILAASDRPGTPSGIGTRRKVFTKTTWAITQTDPATAAVVFHHGGSYTLNGATYKETVEFANENTASLIGQTFTYVVIVTNDTYAQVDGPWNELWRRVS